MGFCIEALWSSCLNINKRQPRGFAFVEFADPYDVGEAQYHTNGQIFAEREISVVVGRRLEKGLKICVIRPGLVEDLWGMQEGYLLIMVGLGPVLVYARLVLFMDQEAVIDPAGDGSDLTNPPLSNCGSSLTS